MKTRPSDPLVLPPPRHPVPRLAVIGCCSAGRFCWMCV